jgi:hypothetical protein
MGVTGDGGDSDVGVPGSEIVGGGGACDDCVTVVTTVSGPALPALPEHPASTRVPATATARSFAVVTVLGCEVRLSMSLRSLGLMALPLSLTGGLFTVKPLPQERVR